MLKWNILLPTEALQQHYLLMYKYTYLNLLGYLS